MTHSGGGIAGLTAAIALTHFTKERRDIKVVVYEAAAKFTDIGAGVGFWPRPWKILKKLGLTNSLENLLEKPPQEFPLREFQKASFVASLKHPVVERSVEVRKSDFQDGITFYDLIIPCEEYLTIGWLTCIVTSFRYSCHRWIPSCQASRRPAHFYRQRSCGFAQLKTAYVV